MGDTLFHLLPEIFLGEPEEGKVRLVLVQPNRNLILGAMILVGFMTFVGLDKAVRLAMGGKEGGGHGHGHGHSHGNMNGKKNQDEDDEEEQDKEQATTALGPDISKAAAGALTELKKRRGVKADKHNGKHHQQRQGVKDQDDNEIRTSFKIGGLLNMM